MLVYCAVPSRFTVNTVECLSWSQQAKCVCCRCGERIIPGRRSHATPCSNGLVIVPSAVCVLFIVAWAVGFGVDDGDAGTLEAWERCSTPAVQGHPPAVTHLPAPSWSLPPHTHNPQAHDWPMQSRTCSTTASPIAASSLNVKDEAITTRSH
ncbi:uncharacterized protein B0I36DRAFT_148201 [Microdochium trichocladiopsis]|uniref:Uncharacterized protein n=1 Tax=Microdochium trichocladiopsis TaxID=1682393 RepID=A0A9P8XYV9_9PEZI|nr:uncharacterized protein B0I36DRAFT_148201 [Microdochium trichocladiopsis]KAH7025699.1 hypothetical protein B0I36DRAFT_148201 [Microdochium trichocladiopsis]